MSDTMTSGFTARVNRTERTQRTIAVDNLLRKTLRVSDPRDPGQIADALLARLPDEADRNRREREGLPYTSIRDVAPLANGTAGTAGVELETARADLERDLQALGSSGSPPPSCRLVAMMVPAGRAAANSRSSPSHAKGAFSSKPAQVSAKVLEEPAMSRLDRAPP